ncbi:dihydrolipoyl dehydrogenase family protein [Rhodococcus chondri]|uniref:NAD(P)/FAD-dependent oxidoreductase n=1 Tax=Rhodococcus chondri TaxID=3065941 RepID=A0ABU7JZR9_9NOCA|nr:NAD(P)/FAD-dependent oxidoreductase [Rhodococcus sp. CC-R104]MEE2035492.1 NAD(P)/FAD-dependent oxidoreductase [Rhodococcus sp. CC-R104]
MRSDTSAADPDTYDVIVLGGGPAGENAAQYAIAGSDRTVALVEHELVGGECSYWACMPSKALLRPTQVLATARHMPGVQQKINARGVNPAAVLARRDGFTHDRDDTAQVLWADAQGIDVLRGRARLTGDRTVTVTGDRPRDLRARHAVVLATGTTAAVPDLPGLRAALPWTSRDATNLREIPPRVLVLGGGPVACETTAWLRQLGAEEVTVVARGPRLLPRVEPFAADAVAARMKVRDVRVRCGTQVRSVTRPDARDTGIGRIHGGPLTVELDDGSTVEVDELVVAAGRRPTTDDLGLGTVGLDDGAALTVDDHLNVDGVDGTWLYAVGDVAGRAALTHMGKYQARVCGDVIAARAEQRPLDGARYRAGADHGQVPQVIFTVPEIASVGHTAASARDAGIDVEVLETELEVAGAALARDDFAGHAALIVDRATDTLVGATFVGTEVAELVHAATVAVVGQVPLDTLWHAVPAYPTVSEVWLRLLETRRP